MRVFTVTATKSSEFYINLWSDDVVRLKIAGIRMHSNHGLSLGILQANSLNDYFIVEDNFPCVLQCGMVHFLSV